MIVTVQCGRGSYQRRPAPSYNQQKPQPSVYGQQQRMRDDSEDSDEQDNGQSTGSYDWLPYIAKVFIW